MLKHCACAVIWRTSTLAASTFFCFFLEIWCNTALKNARVSSPIFHPFHVPKSMKNDSKICQKTIPNRVKNWCKIWLHHGIAFSSIFDDSGPPCRDHFLLFWGKMCARLTGWSAPRRFFKIFGPLRCLHRRKRPRNGTKMEPEVTKTVTKMGRKVQKRQ